MPACLGHGGGECAQGPALVHGLVWNSSLSDGSLRWQPGFGETLRRLEPTVYVHSEVYE